MGITQAMLVTGPAWCLLTADQHPVLDALCRGADPRIWAQGGGVYGGQGNVQMVEDEMFSHKPCRPEESKINLHWALS